MIRFVTAAVFAAAVAGAPAATADPSNLVPACSGQVAETGQCTQNPMEGFFGDASGANPNVPLGLTPQNVPAVVPLGLTPQNLPSNLPLGLTPPNVSGR
jgi:hypothetical protein